VARGRPNGVVEHGIALSQNPWAIWNGQGGKGQIKCSSRCLKGEGHCVNNFRRTKGSGRINF